MRNTISVSLDFLMIKELKEITYYLVKVQHLVNSFYIYIDFDLDHIRKYILKEKIPIQKELKVLDIGNIYLKGFPMLKDTLMKNMFEIHKLQKNGIKTICFGGTRDLIYSSLYSLLFYNINLENYLIENEIPKKFDKVKMPKNIFKSKSHTEFPDFKYVKY